MGTQKYNQFISNVPSGLISRWCQNVLNTCTSSTSGPHKPVKSSCKKPTDRQTNKQGLFRCLSCLPVAQHPRSDHFPGGQETWVQPHPQIEVPQPSLFHSRAHRPALGHLYPARSKEKEGEFSPDLPQAQPRKADRCRQGFGHGLNVTMAPGLKRQQGRESKCSF